MNSKLSKRTTKEILSNYITLVHQKAENCYPVTDILNEVKSIVNKDFG